MDTNTENLKIIIDLASDRGAAHERSERLERDKIELLADNAMLRNELKAGKEENARLRERVAELEAIAQGQTTDLGGTSGITTVVVNQFFLLDKPKTFGYVEALTNDQRMFAAHLLTHTMADNMPKQVFDQVNECCKLDDSHTQRGIHIEHADQVNGIVEAEAEVIHTLNNHGHDTTREE